MTVAIVTTFHGPTNYRGARITATVPERIADRDRDAANDPDRTPEQRALHTAGHWRLTISYPYDLNSEDGHRKAAEMLRDRLGWTGALVAGALPRGYAFTFGDPVDARAILAPLMADKYSTVEWHHIKHARGPSTFQDTIEALLTAYGIRTDYD